MVGITWVLRWGSFALLIQSYSLSAAFGRSAVVTAVPAPLRCPYTVKVSRPNPIIKGKLAEPGDLSGILFGLGCPNSPPMANVRRYQDRLVEF